MSKGHATAARERSSEPLARQVIRHLLKALGVAALVATAFTAWTPASLNPGDLVGQLLAAVERQDHLGAVTMDEFDNLAQVLKLPIGDVNRRRLFVESLVVGVCGRHRPARQVFIHGTVLHLELVEGTG